MLNICYRNPLAVHKIHRTKTVHSSSWNCELILRLQPAQATPTHVHLCPSWPSQGLGAADEDIPLLTLLSVALSKGTSVSSRGRPVLLELLLPESYWDFHYPRGRYGDMWGALLTPKANSSLFRPWLIKNQPACPFQNQK